jgi:choline transport protein
MSCILVLSAITNGMTNMATASRQLFAFARDKGLPFSPWFSRVDSRFEVPTNGEFYLNLPYMIRLLTFAIAVLFTIAFSVLFSLVNIGSTVAFNQILSLGIASLLSSYLISICCIIWRRLTHQPLLERAYNLGKLGLPINLAAIAFLVLTLVMSFFPGMAHPTTQTMNWSCLAYGATLIIGTVYYVIWARHVYDGPVEYVRKSA